MAGVKVVKMSKSYGNTNVFNDLEIEIRDGEFMSLVGPSGCGKSTLLRIVAGLEDADRGQVVIDNSVMNRVRPKNRNVAMVFQSYALYPHLSVYENIALPLKMRHLNKAQRLPLAGRFMPGRKKTLAWIDREVKQTAEALQIGHLLERKPGKLSGGQPAKGGAWPGHGAKAPGFLDGRAAFQPGRQAPGSHAGRDRPAQQTPGDDLHLRDPRPGGGHDHVRPNRGDDGRRHTPGGFAQGGLQQPGRHPGGGIHRQPQDKHPAGHGHEFRRGGASGHGASRYPPGSPPASG